MMEGKINLRKLKYLGITLFLSIIILGSNITLASAAVQKKAPYLIKINRYYNTVTVYEQDEAGEYSIPVKAMTCSVGSQARTLEGTFALKEKYRWKLLMGDVYGQYATRIVKGILFHSVYYYENQNPASLATTQYNKLGKAASHGCIRLTVADAKWIYDNCATGTTVIIYDDKKTPGPLGKPKTLKAERAVGWDPTDPDERNPYLKRTKTILPEINGVKDVEVAWGSKVDVTKGITAVSTAGRDITSKLEVEGKVDTYIPGKYEITYYVEDEYKEFKMRTAIYTVQECPEVPVITGSSNRIVGPDKLVGKKLALEGVEAYCKNVKLKKSFIKVKIESVSTEEYQITYQVKIGNKESKQLATVYVDWQAPSIQGVADQQLAPNQVLDVETALKGISVSDNYSAIEPSDIKVSIQDTPEGNYLVTYTATDEAGNVASASATYYKAIQ